MDSPTAVVVGHPGRGARASPIHPSVGFCVCVMQGLPWGASSVTYQCKQKCTVLWPVSPPPASPEGRPAVSADLPV